MITHDRCSLSLINFSCLIVKLSSASFRTLNSAAKSLEPYHLPTGEKLNKYVLALYFWGDEKISTIVKLSKRASCPVSIHYLHATSLYSFVEKNNNNNKSY